MSNGARLVRFMLVIANGVLLTLGITMAIYSLYAYHNFEEAKHSQEDNVSHFEVAMDTLESFTPNISFLNSTKVPVYITTLGTAGIFTIITAATGLYATDNGSSCCLSLYSLELVIMLAFQIAVITLVYKYHLHIPEDQKEAADSKIVHYLMKQEKISKGLALGVFCLQVVCLISSCCLKSMKWVPRDEFEEEDEVYNRSQPLLHVSSPTHAEQRKDPWSERMMQRYGLDTRDFSYQPESQNQNVERPKKGRCAIM